MGNTDDTPGSDDRSGSASRIARSDDRDWTRIERGNREFRRAQLGRTAGSEQLGCSLHEVPPGKETWPYHYHTANEEAVYVLSGEAVLRTPAVETEISAGDYVAFPADEAGAHAIRNEADEPLRYLSVSTMTEPDVLGYPDAEAVGVYTGAPPGGDEDDRLLPAFYRQGDAVDFWPDVADESDGGE